ncbi:MAG: three-Cys-motif partner protein TcmP [Gammaproteobacteria bacterium]|nr:three-Cys-motif partner protein TcmP [Gammaproteobacteria bacterium]
MDEHTHGKHLVLKSYLHAWLPIMGRYNQELLIIDGFAGPGIYENGEPGSPLIMLDALIEHSYQALNAQKVTFYFIEKESKRLEHLKQSIANKYESLPKNIEINFHNGTFDGSYPKLLNSIEHQNKLKAPCFAMLDPFGVSDTPMNVINKLLENPKAEVYISFMYSFINRFKSRAEFAAPLDKLYGCDGWRKGISIEDKEERKHFYYNLYKAQLKTSGANHVVHLDLYRKNRLIYALFFATKHHKGSDKMKEAMWRYAPDGDFCFYGSHSKQLKLTTCNPDFEHLKKQLSEKFNDCGWISINAIQSFVASDETDFHTGQTKSQALKPMEKEGIIKIKDGTRKRAMTYPDGTLIKFI